VTFLSDEISSFLNVHQQGFDKRAGDLLLRAGEELSVSDVATLFAVGKAEVKVNKRLSFCIISTGNELVSVNETPAAHQIRSSNKEMLHALLSPYAAGIELRHLPDEREALKTFLQGESIRYDVLCFSGGVSMGKYDYVASELENAQVQTLFHGVQQRPGKPFFFGTREAQVIYAFPGNPVSVLHCATRFLLPFLRGQEDNTRVLNAAIFNKTKLYFYKPVCLLTNGQVQVIEQHGSGDFMGMHGATGFVELAPEGQYDAGSALPYYAFH
jgi:molybdopterin molybdotransferase